MDKVNNITPFSEEEARQFTEEIKQNFETLGERILEAYRRRAWEPLGYKNFTIYTETEFGLSKTESYRLKLNTFVNLSLLPSLGGATYKIPNSQKELLHKLPSEQRVEGFKEAQLLAKKLGRDKPNAKDVKTVVALRLDNPIKRATAVVRHTNNDSKELVKLKKELERKTKALELTLQALKERTLELEQKNNALNAVINALDRIRSEAQILKSENKELRNLLRRSN